MLARVGGRWVRIEVTQLHPDSCTSTSGSKLRGIEQRFARQGKPYGLIIDPNPAAALDSVIKDNVHKFHHYMAPNDSELWLLIGCSTPGIGQVVSTQVLLGRLAQAVGPTAALLKGSKFEKAYVHKIMTDELFEWTLSGGWHELESGDSDPQLVEKSNLLDWPQDGEYMQKLFASRGTDEAISALLWLPVRANRVMRVMPTTKTPRHRRSAPGTRPRVNRHRATPTAAA